MENLSIEASSSTPTIDFNASTGVMRIKGRSIPESADDFWLPILNWFEGYVLQSTGSTTFKIELDYFNIASSKRILFLLYKLNELSEKGQEVGVEWTYRKNDEEMFEVGQDYAYMVKVPFTFRVQSEKDLALAI